jgi:hypothetical protein
MFVAGTAMVGIAHQIVWLARSKEPWRQGNAREAARRAGSGFHLRGIAAAARAHNELRHTPLSGATVDGDGHPLHSWMTAILPFVEEGQLFARVKLDEPWDSPINWPVFMTRVRAFECPGIDHDVPPPESVSADYATNSLLIGPGPPMSLDRIPEAIATPDGGEPVPQDLQ